MNKRRDTLSVGFVDMVFNIAFGFIVLFVLAFILISLKKTEDSGKVTPKAEFMLEMVWNSDSDDDIDIHVKDPLGTVVNFRTRQSGIMYLDKDDLGHRSDTIQMPDGSTKIIPVNKEVVTIRGVVPGRYVVNVHFYGKKTEGDYVNDVMVTLIKLNPYSNVVTVNRVLDEPGQELTAFSFVLDDKGNVTDVNVYDEEKLIR